MLQDIKAVIFDLDGTLADTLGDLAHSMNKALESENLPTHPVESYRKFVGNGISNLVKRQDNLHFFLHLHPPPLPKLYRK